MLKAFTIIGCLAGGYIAAIFTWDRLHAAFIGLEAKAIALRVKARAFEAKLRGL